MSPNLCHIKLEIPFLSSQSLKFRYKILAVTDNNGNDVMEQNEFKINPKYRNRPMAYLRAAKTILYNEVRIHRPKIPKIILSSCVHFNNLI